jgi:hypothetical protein
MRVIRLALALVVVACGVVLVPSAIARGGDTSGIKVTVTPNVVTDASTITASFRAPYRLKKGHKWAVWLQADSCGSSDHPDLAKGGWKFRRAVARGKKVTVAFTPESPGTLSMHGTERRTGQKWCWGWADIKVLDFKRDAGLVGSKFFKIHKTT